MKHLSAIRYHLGMFLIVLHKLAMRFLPYKLGFYLIRAIQFKYYCKLAEYRKKRDGNVRYYVLQVRGKLWCLNDFQIKKLVDKKILSDNMGNARNRRKYSLYIA